MVVAALPPAPTIVSEKQVGGSRLSLLEADYFTLKQQVHDLEWECGDVDSEHKAHFEHSCYWGGGKFQLHVSV